MISALCEVVRRGSFGVAGGLFALTILFACAGPSTKQPKSVEMRSSATTPLDAKKSDVAQSRSSLAISQTAPHQVDVSNTVQQPKWENTPYSCATLTGKEPLTNPDFPNFPPKRNVSKHVEPQQKQALRWVASYVGCRWSSVPYVEPLEFYSDGLVLSLSSTGDFLTHYVDWSRLGRLRITGRKRGGRGMYSELSHADWASRTLEFGLPLAVGYAWVEDLFAQPTDEAKRRYLVLYDERRVPLFAFEDAALPIRTVGFHEWQELKEIGSGGSERGSTERYRVDRYFAGGWHELPSQVEIGLSKGADPDRILVGGQVVEWTSEERPSGQRPFPGGFEESLARLSLVDAESARAAYLRTKSVSSYQPHGKCLLGIMLSVPSVLLAPADSKEPCTLPEPSGPRERSEKKEESEPRSPRGASPN